MAMVLLLASANFQDRLLLSLGDPHRRRRPDAPARGHASSEGRTRAVAPSRPASPRDAAGPAVPERVDDPEWRRRTFDDLQKNLSSQRANAGRIRVPTYEEVHEGLPAGLSPSPRAPMRIKWSLVCFGYQPELAAAWSRCMRAFDAEAKLDEVFGESLFWVVTRTIHCFY